MQDTLVRNILLPLCFGKVKAGLCQRIISYFVFMRRTEVLKKYLFLRKHFLPGKKA